MKSLKKKFSIYQSSQKVRKLWSDYNEAKNVVDSPHCSSTTSTESREGEEHETCTTALSSSTHVAMAAGQEPARALRAFVEAVDLDDTRQAAVLQNLDEIGQGELVATLIELAQVLVGAGPDGGVSLSLSPTVGDIDMAQKSLTVAQTCLTRTTAQRRRVEWKEHFRQLVTILAAEEGAPDGQMLVPLDTDVHRGMLDMKSVALDVLRLFATDHEAVVEIGRCRGFHTIARLALPRESPLRQQAVEMLAFFVAMPSTDLDRSRSPPRHGSRGKTGLWGSRGGQLGAGVGTGGGSLNTGRGPRLSNDCVGGEEERALEASAASSTSSSSLADAASFVYSSFQALISSGRSSSEPTSAASLGMSATGCRGFPAVHLPMAVLPQSLTEEVSRLSTLETDRPKLANNAGVENGEGGDSDGPIWTKGKESVAVNDGDVVQMLLVDGALEVLAGVISPQRGGLDEAAGRWHTLRSLIPLEAEASLEVVDDESLRLKALEAAVLILEGRPQAQAAFERLSGFARISRLLHDIAAQTKQRISCTSTAPSCDPGDARSRSRSRSRTNSLQQAEAPPDNREGCTLDTAFDALFRLALDGHPVAPGARADGVDTVKMLLTLVARSPSPPVALRAARSLQGLLRVRPMNAVCLERQHALLVITEAVANLAFSVSNSERCTATASDGMVEAEDFQTGEGRMGWSVDDKREALSSMNEVVRAIAAVYSRQDARGLEMFVNILLSPSATRFTVSPSGNSTGSQCSGCRATPTRGVESVGVQACNGAAGLRRACDEVTHGRANEDGHVRIPVASRTKVDEGDGRFPQSGTSRTRGDPWAAEAGRALMKAVAIMLDDRESFGLPPTPERKGGSRRCRATAEVSPEKGTTSVLAVMLQIVKDELQEPLSFHSDIEAESCSDTAGQSETAAHPCIAGAWDRRSLSGFCCEATPAPCASGWTKGWLLSAMEVVARVVVRGGSDVVEELETTGGWGLLAHITSLPSPPRHLSYPLQSSSTAIDPSVSVDVDRDDRDERATGRAARSTGSDSERGVRWSDHDRSAETWAGWIGARRLALWIIREALLTGTAGRSSSDNGGVGTSALLDQPARWLVWLVQTLMKATLPSEDDQSRASSEGQLEDQVLMKLAVLNELRLAIGSFAPCEVVMEGSTRVLPLVSLRAASSESNEEYSDEEGAWKSGVSPNRHPQARTGAPNVKVVGRLAGDQRGVVLDALVSAGLMEMLLGIIADGASSSTDSGAAESGLALLLLADLAAGSEKAKACLGSTLGYDTLAKAAHGAGAVIHAHQYSLWLEASLRRVGGATARLVPPFERLITLRDHALAVAFSSKGSSGLEATRSRGLGERGRGESGGSRRRRSFKRRSPSSRGRAAGFKDGMTWVPRALSRGTVEQLGGQEQAEVTERGQGRREFGDPRVEEGRCKGDSNTFSKAQLFDELWLPPGLVKLAQDVLLINRARGGIVVRGEERYFIAQARSSPSASDSGYPLWKPAVSKFRALEAAVFPFLLLPLVPPEHQSQAAEQLSCLLDANPANAAALCHLRVPLALLKLACSFRDQGQVRGVYFRLAAQLMSHHISAADALELFHLASLQPSAWARLGRLRVTSAAKSIMADQMGSMVGDEGAADVTVSDEISVRCGSGEDGSILPPNSGELQMQLLYVIGTVVDAPSPAWFFHMDGGAGSGLFAGPLPRFPPKRTGYSLSMWLRPAGFSGRRGGETGLFSICGRGEHDDVKTLLRVSLQRCLNQEDSSAPPAAVGIGASEDDDGDQGMYSEDTFAKLQVHASTEASSDHHVNDVTPNVLGGTTIASAFVEEAEVRCGRWHFVVLTHSYSRDDTKSSGQWMDGSITVYVDGERRALGTETTTGKSKRSEIVDHGSLEYPAGCGGGSNVSLSVGCWEEDSGIERRPVAAPVVEAGVISSKAAHFSGQIASVALVEGAWSAETAKASFLRGPGAPPPGKRIVFTNPGFFSPTPFLDPVSDVEAPPSLLQGHTKDPREKERSLSDAGKAVASVSQSWPGASDGGADGVMESTSNSMMATSQDAIHLRVQAGMEANAAAPFSAVPSTPPRDREDLMLTASQPPFFRSSTLQQQPGPPATPVPPRLSVILAPIREAIDLKYGVAQEDRTPRAGSNPHPDAAGNEQRHGDEMASSASLGEETAGCGMDVKSALLSDSMSLTVNSLAVAAGCGGKGKDPDGDSRVSFRFAKGSGTSVYATTPLHAAVQAAGGFRLCLPFLRLDHARQVAALRILAGLLEASAEGMDAFRVRDGFNVLYHALAQGDDAFHQLSMDTFDTLFELMTSEAIQGALEVSASSASPVNTLLDPTARTADSDDVRPAFLASGCAGVKLVRSPEALRLVVDLLGHCERKPDLQAKVMEALVDSLDGSSAGIQVWRRAFTESEAFAPLLYLLSPPAFVSSEEASTSSSSLAATDIALHASGGNSGSVLGGRSLSRISTSFSISSSGPAGIASTAHEDSDVSGARARKISMGGRPASAAGAAARNQAARMVQVLVAGSAAVAPAVRPQDPTAAVASSTSAGCTPEHLADLVGFVLRCHLEVEELTDIIRRQVLNTGQDERFGGAPVRRSFPQGSAQSQLTLTLQVCGTVMDLLVQLCGGDGGAVVVGMMSQAFPAGGNFLVALELLSSSNVETRINAIKLLSLMLVRKGDDGRRPSTSTFFSSDDSASGLGRPGPDRQALRAFEKLGGFAAMARQLELHATCPAMCDALMGMIFGVWGSKHEPRPIREKDVLAIKGNKESWLRAWWSSYSSPPDEDATNTNNISLDVGAANAAPGAAPGGPSSAEASTSIVQRLKSTATAATSGSLPVNTPFPDQSGTELPASCCAAAAVAVTAKAPLEDKTINSGSELLGGSHDQEGDGRKGGDKGTTATGVNEVCTAAGGVTTTQMDKTCQNSTGGGETTTAVTIPSGNIVKPGRLAALIKSKVDVTHGNSTAAVGREALVSGSTAATAGFADAGGLERKAGDKDKDKDREEKSFLSGLFRRLSIDTSGGEVKTPAATGTAPFSLTKAFPPSSTDVKEVAEGDVAVPSTVEAEVSKKQADAAEKPSSSSVDVFDAVASEAREAREAREGIERKRSHDAGVTNTNGGDRGNGGGSNGDSESLSLVLPEAVEVLMRALQRAQSPAVISRCLLQLESAVAWLPSVPTPEEDRESRVRHGARKDHGAGSGRVDEEGVDRSNAEKPGSSGGTAATRKGADGGDRERNANALMSRQGWLAWCQRLVDALSVRNDSGDLVPRRGANGYPGFGYGGNDSSDMIGGGMDRWGAGGSEASEAGGYFDDSHSETTDTGSAFSYLESISIGQSMMPDGGIGALEAFTGPVYSLVAALLEQDMARAPRDKRGHRFLDLFCLTNGSRFQVAVLENALDGVQDSPMLSTEGVQNSRTSTRVGRGETVSGDGGGDGSVLRLESLRELLEAALHHHPDLPLGLCVKGVHTINLLGYHGSHETRSKMKSVGLLRMRDELIRRCLFHPVATSWEKVLALSQVEDALETLVSPHAGNSSGEADAAAAGEVALQLLLLFGEATAAVVSQTTPGPATTGVAPNAYGGVVSPVTHNSAVLAGRRTIQVAAARALGRVAAASSICRSTVIRLARDQQLLVRLLPALRCPLTIEEVEAIEMGNIPEDLPTLPGGSRWSLGSLSLLPTSTAPTTVPCMTDDTEDKSAATAGNHSPQRTKTFFPLAASPSNNASAAAGSSWPPSVPSSTMTSFLTGPSSETVSSSGVHSGSGHGPGAATCGGGSLSSKLSPANAGADAAAAAAAAAAAVRGGAVRLDEVVEEEEWRGGQTDQQGCLTAEEMHEQEVEIDLHEATAAASVLVEAGVGGGAFPEAEASSGPRRRHRRRSSSDVSSGSIVGIGASGGSSSNICNRSQAEGSWHDPKGLNVGGGWGVPEHHDLETFVQWYSHRGQCEVREGLQRRVSKALAPLTKAREKAAAKQASKRERTTRQSQKREQEATSAKEKAATDSLERCRSHAEFLSDRTTSIVDSWLAGRRQRWEAGKTRCHELAPPAGVPTATPAAAVAGRVRAVEEEDSSFAGGSDHLPMKANGASGTAVSSSGGEGMVSGGKRQAGGRGELSRWNWERDVDGGASFNEFLETFAGGVEDEEIDYSR